jgi:hypothetical protein
MKNPVKKIASDTSLLMSYLSSPFPSFLIQQLCHLRTKPTNFLFYPKSMIHNNICISNCAALEEKVLTAASNVKFSNNLKRDTVFELIIE